MVSYTELGFHLSSYKLLLKRSTYFSAVVGCVAAYAEGIYVLVMDDCRLQILICRAVQLCWL